MEGGLDRYVVVVALAEEGGGRELELGCGECEGGVAVFFTSLKIVFMSSSWFCVMPRFVPSTCVQRARTLRKFKKRDWGPLVLMRFKKVKISPRWGERREPRGEEGGQR